MSGVWMYGRVVLGMGDAAGEGGEGGVEVVMVHTEELVELK